MDRSADEGESNGDGSAETGEESRVEGSAAAPVENRSRDESGSRGGDRDGRRDHESLASLLSKHDLAIATDPRRTPGRHFAFDPDRDPETVFPQSVSSGGPTRTGVILWTRIAPDVFDGDEPLGLEVARDADFSDPVYRGVVEDEASIAAHDYTVKVDLDGAVNYPTLLGLTASLRVGLPASPTRFFSGVDCEVSSATGSAVSTDVDSECPTPIDSTG